MINTDLKALKVKAYGCYTINTKPVTEHRDKRGTLCDYCCNKDSCSIIGSLNTAKNNFASRFSIVIDDCSEYVPPIKFLDLTGTSSRFNTFRLGKAWAGRVRNGTVIGMVDERSEVIGHARVEGLHVVTKKQAYKKYAKDNHIFVDQDISRARAGREMESLLPKLYGPLFVNNNSHITVIKLRRI